MREFPNYLMKQESRQSTSVYHAAIEKTVVPKEEKQVEKRWVVEKQTFKPTVLPPVLQQPIKQDDVDYASIKRRLMPQKSAYILFDVNNRVLHHELEEMGQSVEAVVKKNVEISVNPQQVTQYKDKGVKRGLHRTMDGIFEQEPTPTQYFKSQR